MDQLSQITADEVQKAINEKKDIILLDVRTQEEYGAGIATLTFI